MKRRPPSVGAVPADGDVVPLELREQWREDLDRGSGETSASWRARIRLAGPIRPVAEGTEGGPTPSKPSAGVDDTLTGLVDRYLEPHRRYHSSAHVFSVLWQLEHMLPAEGIDEASDEARAIRFALWYHDAIYDPRASDNEERSAVLAAQQLGQLHVVDDLVDAVTRLILITRHPSTPCERDEAVVLDADLSILHAPQGIYDHYVRQVREEYAFVSDDDWRAGRSRVLRSFIDAPQIYHSVAGIEWESAARSNLARELHTLAP